MGVLWANRGVSPYDAGQLGGADAVAGDVAVEEEDDRGDHQHGEDAGKAGGTVDEVVVFVKAEKNHRQTCHTVAGAVHDGCHDDGAALDAEILDDEAHGYAHHYHHEDAPLGMLRVVVPHEDERCVPQPPDDADNDGGAEERPSFELLEQVSAPAHLLAEGKEGVDGDTRQHAREEDECRHARGTVHSAERQRYAKVGVVKAAYPVGEEQREQRDDGEGEPTEEPPAVDLPADSEVAQEGFFVHFLTDERCHQWDKHTDGSKQLGCPCEGGDIGSREIKYQTCCPDKAEGDGDVEFEVFHRSVFYRSNRRILNIPITPTILKLFCEHDFLAVEHAGEAPGGDTGVDDVGD